MGFVPLWRAGGQSQGNAWQTGGGFCSCVAFSALSSRRASAGSLNSLWFTSLSHVAPPVLLPATNDFSLLANVSDIFKS